MRGIRVFTGTTNSPSRLPDSRSIIPPFVQSELTRQGISLVFSYSVPEKNGLYLRLPVFITQAISRHFFNAFLFQVFSPD